MNISFLFQIVSYFAFFTISVMSHQSTNRETGANEQSTAIMTPIHEVTSTRTTAPLGKIEFSMRISVV